MNNSANNFFSELLAIAATPAPARKPIVVDSSLLPELSKAAKVQIDSAISRAHERAARERANGSPV